MSKKSARRNIIIYGLCCLACFLDITKMYPMLLLLAVVVAFNIRTLVKASRGEEQAPALFYEDKLIDKIKGTSGKQKASLTHSEIREKKKLYANAYDERLRQIEEDFPDDIYDDEDDDDE